MHVVNINMSYNSVIYVLKSLLGSVLGKGKLHDRHPDYVPLFSLVNRKLERNKQRLERLKQAPGR